MDWNSFCFFILLGGTSMKPPIESYISESLQDPIENGLHVFTKVCSVCSTTFSGLHQPGYPLVMTNITMERSTIFHGKIHYKWPLSIAMLVYQRVHQDAATTMVHNWPWMTLWGLGWHLVTEAGGPKLSWIAMFHYRRVIKIHIDPYFRLFFSIVWGDSKANSIKSNKFGEFRSL